MAVLSQRVVLSLTVLLAMQGLQAALQQGGAVAQQSPADASAASNAAAPATADSLTQAASSGSGGPQRAGRFSIRRIPGPESQE